MNKVIKHLDTLQNSILPKFLNLFNDDNKKRRIENNFAIILPKKVLEMKEEDYMQINNLTKEQIIKNSILYSTLEIEEEDLDYLAKYFIPLLYKPKLRIDTNLDVAIYLEVLQILNYAQEIRSLINNHPKSYANHYGLKYRTSSEKNIIKSHLSHLQERLDNPFFKFDEPNLIEITKEQIRIIKIFQTKENKTLPSALNWIEGFIGLDNRITNFNSRELKVLRQVLFLFNGIRTTKEAYVKSFMIFTFIQCDLKISDNKINTQYANSILEIAKYLFNDIFILDAKKKRKTLNFKKEHLIRGWYTKTVINKVPIFAFETGKQEDFLIKQAKEGFADMMKIPSINLFEKDVSAVLTITAVKNLYRSFGTLGFTKNDIRVFIELSQLINEQNLLQDTISLPSTK